jgi:hypothetical protein
MLAVLLLTAPLASSQSQSLTLDANGFLIATEDEVKATGRTVTLVGDASKPGRLSLQLLAWSSQTLRTCWVFSFMNDPAHATPMSATL